MSHSQCKNQHNKVENMLLPAAYKILAIEKHTVLEWNFRVAVDFKSKLGQFVEVSLPMVGEAPISVSDCGDGWMDLLIRKVGHVTNELFKLEVGDTLWLRGSYGNGYDLNHFIGHHLLVVAGGTGVAPVKGVMSYFSQHPEQLKKMDVILGYKNMDAVLYKEEMKLWRRHHQVTLTLDQGEPSNEYIVGRVTEPLQQLAIPDLSELQVIVVGPPIMISSSIAILLEKGIKPEQIWVDHERRMACSVGKCGHCRIGEIYVCVDGPIFNYSEAQYFKD